MNERAFRCLPVTILIFTLLLTLPTLAVAEEGTRVSARERAAFAAVAPPQAVGCGACAVAHKSCSNACFGLRDKAGECLTACDNAAAKCTCDQAVGLRSEELVNFEWPSLAKDACHGFVSCQPDYPSCASWSSYADCGDPTCVEVRPCGECEYIEGHLFCGRGPAWRQFSERFRVCFDQFGNSCTEWQQTSTTSCGC